MPVADIDLSVPVVVRREPLRCDASPVEVLLCLRGDDRPFGLVGRWADGGAIIGSEPTVVVQNPRGVMDALACQPPVVGGADYGVAIGGGWVGYLGFQLGREIERLDAAPPAPLPLPAGVLGFYDHVLRRDLSGRWWFEALVTPERESAINERQAELAARLTAPGGPRPFATRGWRWSPDLAAHACMVEACRQRIHAGDLLQANLATRLEGELDGDLIDLFATATGALPTDRAAYLAGPWGALASSSPELFLDRRGRTVRTAPIKGTRPAGRAGELATSEKDRAENVMIVDLMRNDLGKVCRPGSIQVSALAEVRRHAGVAHLVSEIAGRLRDGVTDADLVRATFPPGSVTGAPKVAALNAISELESTRREAYTGAIGFASPLGRLQLSVAIRTFEARDGRVWLGAGGGIVAESSGPGEAAEAAAKALPLLAAIGAEPPVAREPRRAPAHVRRAPRPTPRPDPAAGVYETVRIASGMPCRWPARRRRFAASLHTLYRVGLPDDLDQRVAAIARDVLDARLRIDYIPGEDLRLEASALPTPQHTILRPVLLPGGIGAHKWRDRTLLEAHETDTPDMLPLLIDANGYLLETSRTAIIVRDTQGRLRTPPPDGRILPSITAAASGAKPSQLTLTDLHAARRVYVASALRELEPASLAEDAACHAM